MPTKRALLPLASKKYISNNKKAEQEQP